MKRRLTQALGGGLVFATFGCLWASYGVYSLGRTDLPWLLAIPLAVTMIMILTLGRFQKKVDALPAEPASPEQDARDARGRRMFTIVNAVQAVAIFLAVQLWFNLHRPEYLAPTIAVIVGLHFFALAGPMEMPSHRIVGGLMCLVALVTIIAVPSHQSWAVTVGFGNAAILWGAGMLRFQLVRRSLDGR